MLPQSYVTHRTRNRIRIKIPRKRGDAIYFQNLKDKFDSFQFVESIQVNPLTGSLLIIRQKLDIDGITSFAESEKLFTSAPAKVKSLPLSRQLVEPIANFSDSMKRSSDGYIDLPGLIFLVLLGGGIYELLKGNLVTPPWYTFLWYAFGVFTKSVVDSCEM